jgi:hypothetical protein
MYPQRSHSTYWWPFSLLYSFSGLGWDKILRITLLLSERFRERGYASHNSSSHKENRHKSPDETPALGRASVAGRKDRSVGRVDFTEDKVITLEKISIFNSFRDVNEEDLQCPKRCITRT